ncbi:MAG: amidohydrolase, partial [Clostridia bacterium]|nr:amidohydrolase [Clostridia bacterium]
MAEWYREASDAIRGDMEALSDSIFSHPELGYEEFLSSQEHADVLRRYGFVVEKPYMGLETGYRATFDSGRPGPRVCYMAEYDALPGVGHGCGHNMLGTVSVAAGIILSKKLAECGGSVVVLGTPAEETSGAKVKYAREGAFDDCDVAIVNHPCIGG